MADIRYTHILAVRNSVRVSGMNSGQPPPKIERPAGSVLVPHHSFFEESTEGIDESTRVPSYTSA